MTTIEKLNAPWEPPQLPSEIPHGDMPGDHISIYPDHVRKAETLFRALRPMLASQLSQSAHGRVVISVCGGSGAGKTGIASVLAYFLRDMGIGTYLLSGDNYPRRIPQDNDQERIRVFRVAGLRGLLAEDQYTPERMAELCKAWEAENDADPQQAVERPWMKTYQQAGRKALAQYLGTPGETDFDEVNQLLASFKQGQNLVYLKRMGRQFDELWYDPVDMTGIEVLLLEWTHGNSEYLFGVDLPILLNSTPAQTLAHRMARNRDGKIDSPFVAMVLDIEQQKLDHQAHKARLVLSREGELLDYAAYRSLSIDASERGTR